MPGLCPELVRESVNAKAFRSLRNPYAPYTQFSR